MKHREVIIISIVLALLLINFLPASALTFTVNSAADGEDVNQGDGICETTSVGECTLRAAIMEANGSPGTDTISFNIPGAGPHTITPSYGFDFIFDPVIIDGTTQPGFAGTPIIELDGSNAGPDAYGIVIYAGSSTVRGLVINRFALAGIDLDVNGNNTIQGNYIGTDLTGTVDLGNGTNGVAISQGSGGNLIGGTAAGDGNLISGNGEFGIIIVDPGSNNNIIQGNFIGTDGTGAADLGNTSVGVVIGAGASDNLVGGTEAGARNIISGNDSAGLHIDTIGTTGNVVQGNYIGTDITGTLALGNVFEGIFLGGGTSNNVIGGVSPGAGNLISGNNGYGITIADVGTTGNIVQGNYIGTDVTGTLPLGNSDNGVILATGAMKNLIGGTAGAAGNMIAFNNVTGIVLTSDAGTGNFISSNSIHSNGDLGIDLGWDGVTLSDRFDLDSGVNNLQNFPILTMVKNISKRTVVKGVLVTSANTAFRLEFFSSEVCDSSGYGEGQSYLGSAHVRTNRIGRANFRVTFPTSFAVGSFVTATATDPANNTSEFSQCVLIRK
jgi:CSLREA domain-containing protein